jgi:SAM-dependent methyltransferase
MSNATLNAPDISSTVTGISPVNTLPALGTHLCRNCQTPLRHVFVDLGTSPLCESYLTPEQLDQPEPFYPLVVYTCERCLLVQLPTHVSGEHIFQEYAYFSSFSTSYLEHARRNVESLIERFDVTAESFVVELASNDGYLLKNFVERGIPCLGVEPAANVAKAATQRNVPTLVKFFGRETAREVVSRRRQADVVIANNVLAHVPDLHDFLAGLKLLLADRGVAVVELQHLLRLVERNQFDTIYHEHYCYFTLLSFAAALAHHDLALFDVEEIPTHGGSFRAFIRHSANSALPVTQRVGKVFACERAAGLDQLAGHEGFADKVAEVKRNLLAFLIDARRRGCTVAGYGAPGKGNTLLNYCGIRQDFLDYTVDRNPYKHGRFLPGSRIPIFQPERIAETKPDYVLILPWNLREEISAQLAYIRDWGGKLVVPIPELEVW